MDQAELLPYNGGDLAPALYLNEMQVDASQLQVDPCVGYCHGESIPAGLGKSGFGGGPGVYRVYTKKGGMIKNPMRF